MFSSAIIDVALGLVFVYLLLSLLCSAISEIIEAFLKKRAKNLAQGIKVLLLEDPFLVRKIYEHPLIAGLSRGKYKENEKGRPKGLKLPSYIPSQNFALALMSMLELGGESWEDSIEKIDDPKVLLFSVEEKYESALNNKEIPDDLRRKFEESGVPLPDASDVSVEKGAEWLITDGSETYVVKKEDNKLNIYRKLNQKVKDVIKALAVTVTDGIGELQENIEAWYNSAMERVSGWYKRRAQGIILAIAYVAAISMNVNTITIVDRLSDDGALREVLVTHAEKFLEQPVSIEPETGENDEQPGNITPEANDEQPGNTTPEANDRESGQQPTPSEKFSKIKAEIEKLGLPIGWPESEISKAKDLDNWLKNWLIYFFGWSATAFAVTLGAPFWFDLLSKFINIRSTVKSKGGKSSENTDK